MAAVFGEFAGKRVSIYGNGPSLLTTPMAADRGTDWRIGVHHAWKHSCMDALLFADTDPYLEFVRDGPGEWIWPAEVFINLNACKPEPLLDVAPAHVRVIGFLSKYGGLERWPRPGSETREFLNTGTFPGQQPRNRNHGLTKPTPNSLVCATSSVCPALHLALIMGSRDITLVGVDCGGSQDSFINPKQLSQQRVSHFRLHIDQLKGFRSDWEPLGVKCRALSGNEMHGWPKPEKEE